MGLDLPMIAVDGLCRHSGRANRIIQKQDGVVVRAALVAFQCQGIMAILIDGLLRLTQNRRKSSSPGGGEQKSAATTISRAPIRSGGREKALGARIITCGPVVLV